MKKKTGPKRNIWKDPSPYGTYEGQSGNPELWKSAFEFAVYTREKALGILKDDSPYVILGISITATVDEIKKAARLLFVKYHPDKGGDRDTFERIMAAYSILVS